MDQIVFEGEPVTHDFKKVYAELKCIRDGNHTRSRKLQKLSAELLRFASRLANYSGTLTHYWRMLSECLRIVGPWLNSLSEHWLTLELLVEHCTAQQPLMVQAANLTGLTRRLLSDPQLQVLVGKELVGQLDQRLAGIDQLLAQVRLWRALPDDAGLGDYVQLVAGHPLLGGALADSLHRLGQVLGMVQKGYPVAGMLSEKLAWLLATLSDPVLREPLQRPMERLLGSPQSVEQLFSLCRVVESLRRFPQQGPLGDQALWLLSLLKHHEGQAGAWLGSCHTVLGADPATLSLVNRLLSSRQSPESGLLLIKDLLAALALPVAHLVAGQTLPTYAVQGLRALQTLYRQRTPNESWASLARRIAQSVMEIAKPYAVGALMGHPLAAATVHYAEALQTHTGWEQSCQWFVAHAPAGDLTLQFAYGQYLNALLVWQVYQACAGHDPLQAEDRLRHLVRRLKEYQVIKSYPQLEPLIDLLPLFPLLMEARRSVNVQPTADSWLGWGSQWLNALASSASSQRGAMELHQRLSRQLEHWLADALVAVLSKFPMGPPGATAASTSGVVGRTFKPVSAGRGPHGLLLGGISLEALGLGAVGYALWQARGASNAGAPLAEAETGLMGGVARAGGRGLSNQKAPLLLGLAAMAAGGFLLSRWTHVEAPAATSETANDSSDASSVDVDSPIYTFYVNETVAQAKENLLRAWTATSRNLSGWPGPEQKSAVIRFDDIDARSLFALPSLDTPEPASSAPQIVIKRHDRRRREITGYSPAAFGSVSPQPVDSCAETARRALDFEKYDEDVAARFNRLWDGLIALASDPDLIDEERTHRYLIRFFRLLIIQMGLNESALVDLGKSGTDAHSKYRATLRWMAALVTEAVEVFDKIPRTQDTEPYFAQWEIDSPWGEVTHLLNQAFGIKDLSSQTYAEQWHAWSYPLSSQDDLTAYLERPGLSNSEKLWRLAIASEANAFRQSLQFPANEPSVQTIPLLLVDTFKARIEALGCEIYALLSKKQLSEGERLGREVAIAELDMRKFCLLNMLLGELDSYDIDQRLTSDGPIEFNYSGHEAVFEAKKRAVELLMQKFAVDVPALDDDEQVLAYTLISQDSNVSDEARSYLHKSASLAFAMMTRSTSTHIVPYERWNNLLSLNFTRAASATEYFRRLYEEEPAGYRGLDTFRKSNESDTWCDYYQQFIDYKDRFIDFDARRLAYTSLLGLGLTDYSISQMQPKRIVYASLDTYFKLNVELKRLLNSGEQRNPQDKFEKMLDSPTPWPGTVGFIILADGRVLAMAGINFKVTVKLFEREAVQSSKALQKICELPALPYRSEVLELEGKGLIETVLKPLFAGDADGLLSANDHPGYPVLKAPRESRTWWQRTQREHEYSCSGSELLPVADQVMKKNLQQWVGLLKQANKHNDFWGGVLSVLPLYTEIRDSTSDPEHRLDANSIMWDIAGILLSIMPAISGMTKLGEAARKIVIRTALSELIAGASLKTVTRQTLFALLHNPQFMKGGLKGFAYAAYAGFDILAPFPPGLIVAPLIRGTTHIRRYLQTHSVRAVKTTPDLTAVGTALVYTDPASAEMTALEKISVTSMASDKTLTLRGSELGAGEVLEASRALWQPVARRQPIVRRVGERPGYSTFDTCAPYIQPNRSKRSAYKLCVIDAGYRVPANLLESGIGYKIYNVDSDFVVKDYLSATEGDLYRRTQKAWNNSEAFKRLYAKHLPNESVVWTALLGRGVETTVSVRLGRLSGKSLSKLIEDEDLTAIEGIRLQATRVIIDGLVERLGKNGVLLNYIRLDDVVYDAESRLFSLRNFDNARINPADMPLSEHQANISRKSLDRVFAEFDRLTECMVVDDFGLDISPLSVVERARLMVHRSSYLDNVRLQQAGAQANQFNYAKKNHRAFTVPGVSRLDSELKLTLAYNHPNGVLTAEQRGALSGFIENTRIHRFIQESISAATKYSRILQDGSIDQIIAPQTYLMAAAGVSSVETGRCYQLVLGVAVAIKENRVSNFFLNLYRSAARTDASRNEMIRALDQLRKLPDAHFLMPEANGEARGLDFIVSHLDRRNHTSLYTLSGASHAMLLGVTLDSDGIKTFQFYEPNVGLFSYPSAKALNSALRRTLGTSAMSEQYGGFNISKGPGYKFSRIETFILKSKRVEVRLHSGLGFRSRTVAQLCHELNDVPACRLGRAPSGRSSRAIDCLSTGLDLIAIEAIQEALFTRSMLPARDFESLVRIDTRVLAHYQTPASMREDLYAALLVKSRQQLMLLCGQSQGLPAPNMTSLEERVAYLNYLAVLMLVVTRMAMDADTIASPDPDERQAAYFST